MGAPAGSTRVAAVIGHPVVHSLSPRIHNAAFGALGLDWVYVAFDVAPGGAADAVDAVRALGLGGLSVTMPHKEDAARSVDRCEPVAQRLGAVNCVWVDPDDGGVVGANTDGEGFIHGLRRDHGVDPGGMKVLVVGAGGAARAVIDACGESGATEIAVAARRPDARRRAAALAGAAGVEVPHDDIDAMQAAVRRADLVVNATPVGMDTHPGVPLPLDAVGSSQIVVDLIYHPSRTALLSGAGAAGAGVSNGLSMLVGQAAAQFRRWTGREMPVEAVIAAL